MAKAPCARPAGSASSVRSPSLRAGPALRRGLAALALLAAGGAAEQAAAQTSDDFRIDAAAPVSLVADRVTFDEGAQTVTATGNVEVYQGGRTLTAEEIVYDAANERLSARGPIVLNDPEAGVVVLADMAQLDTDLREGVVRGARAFIGEGEGTVAAVEGRRVGGRYSAFSKAVYSSCAVCPESPTPLWAIRARRVVHDEVENVIYYEDPVFELLGTPVAWAPFFSMPDPTVERLSGVLAPTFLRSDRFGEAVKLPYFIVIDPTRDATLTPFLTTEDGPIVEGEYRQRLDRGAFDVTGSLGWVDTDETEDATLRGHLFGDGVFEGAPLGFGRGSEVGFEIEVATDDAYLRRYEYTDRDRLESVLFARRYGTEGFYEVNAVRFQSLREDEFGGGEPLALPEFWLRQPLDAPAAYGDFALEASGVALTRFDEDDTRRLTGALDWERREVLPGGFVGRGFAQTRGDLYSIDEAGEDHRFEARFAPFAGIELAFPLVSAPEGRGTHLLEPLAQLVAAPTDLNDDIPNEDSLIVEFDEKNLFEPNRFPGFDRVESGTRANLGLRYSYVGDGLALDATGGRVLRLQEEGAFSGGAGLSEQRSDWVAGWSVQYDDRLSLTHRIRVADDGELARNEALGAVDLGRARLKGSYVFLEEDAQQGAEDDREEVTLGAELDLTRSVTVAGFVRRDLGEGEYVDIEGAIGWRNECAALELYGERDFTDTDEAPASTTFGLRVQLFGLADSVGPRSGVCAVTPAAYD